jgi:hypothetical protein
MTGQVQPASIAALLPGFGLSIAPAVIASLVSVIVFVLGFFIAERLSNHAVDSTKFPDGFFVQPF